jgi:hypothetical protein
MAALPQIHNTEPLVVQLKVQSSSGQASLKQLKLTERRLGRAVYPRSRCIRSSFLETAQPNVRYALACR